LATNPKNSYFRKKFFGAVSTAINEILRSDQKMAAKISRLEGKTIGIYIKGTDVITYLVPHGDGLKILSNFDGEVDVRVTGSTADFIAYIRASKRGKSAGAGRIEINGDLSTAQSVQEILSEFTFDWEEMLSHIFGDVAAHRFGRVFRTVNEWAATFSEGFEYDLRQYLKTESRLLPTRHDKEQLGNAIFTLADDVNRLEARIRRLTRDPAEES